MNAWVPPRLIVGDRVAFASVDARSEPLGESDAGEVVLRGWFDERDGEVAVHGLWTFRFVAGADVASAQAHTAAAHDGIVHSFYATAIPLIAWACGGVEAFHASAVHCGDGVVAFCGSSGAGKTTLAYGLAARGHERFAEDAVAFRAGAGGVEAVPLPFTTNLREPSSAYFAQAGAAASSPAEVHRFGGGESLLTAVVLLEPGADVSAPPVLERLAPSEALLALLPNAYRFRSQPAERERRMLDAYLALVTQVRVYRLAYAQRFDQLTRVLKTVEAAARP